MLKEYRSRLGHLAVYAAVRSAVLLFQLMPLSWAMAVARLGAWLAYRLNKRHRLVAADNLRHAFPRLSDAQIDGHVRATYLHLFTMAIETAILLRRMRCDNVSEFVRDADPDDERFVWGLLQSDQPVIVMTGHLGNWEMLSLATGASGADAAVVARKLDNPYLDAWVREVRQSTGMLIVDKDGASAEAVEVLKRGGTLGVVGDQDAGAKGLFVDFFGRPASTFKSIALLSLRFDAPILVVGCVRTGEPLWHSLFLEDVILPADYENNPNAVRAITQRYTSALERIVRRHPEQYFWLHRRWKHQPQAKPVRKAA